ncbi:chaperonin Cpn60 [Halorubrum salipaludis]|uniref:Chaperonin Cpn60 n=1 Tax=Halorubrum salipaludis TaxID=2032630 RepID=A0A2A2FGG3_9EURY|nr:thermosome subunit beta [Halorubrum salipaludis]PAU83950.1 chaperonin Cpn60 [Halorubrum salipaludis]
MSPPAHTSDTDRTDPGTDTIAPGVAVAETVRSTLGPNGRDKMIVGRDGTVIVTNTGSSILDRLEVDDPIGRVVVGAAEAQDRRVGDGTTTQVLLVGELLSTARSLFDRGVHPTAVAAGYKRAAGHARERLEEYAVPLDRGDEGPLRRVAMTAVTGRWDEAAARQFAEYTLSALRAVDFDVSRLTLHDAPGGDLFDSSLIDGIAVDMDASSTAVDGIDAGTPRSYTAPAIAAVDAEITPDAADASGTLSLDDPDDLAEMRAYARDSRAALVESVAEAGTDVLFCQKSIDDAVRTALSRRGVLAVERTRQDEFDAIVRATGASRVMDAGALDADALGRGGAVERRSVGRSSLLVVTDCPEETHASLVLRGGTPHVAAETRRIVTDCVDVVRQARRDGAVVPGGGASWLALARDVSARADALDGREQLAAEGFAESLEAVPRVLAENAGLDPIDALAELRSRHHDGDRAVGVDAGGSLRDMRAAGVLEPVTVVDACLANALETTARILRIDEVLPAESAADGASEGHAHGGPTGTGGHGSQTGNHGGHAADHGGGYPWALSH